MKLLKNKVVEWVQIIRFQEIIIATVFMVIAFYVLRYMLNWLAY